MINITNQIVCITAAVVFQVTSVSAPLMSLVKSMPSLYVATTFQIEKLPTQILLIENRAVNDARHHLFTERQKLLADFSEAEKDRSLASIVDAATIMSKVVFAARPNIYMTDDGVSAIQIKVGDSGLLLLFTGDGTLTVSNREPDRYYVSSFDEYDLEGFRSIPKISKFLHM